MRGVSARRCGRSGRSTRGLGRFGLAFEEFDDEGGDEGLFGGLGLGDKESESGQGAVGDFGVAGAGEVLVVDGEKNDKEEGADAFVAVIEGVVLDNEVEEVGGLFGDGSIEVFPVVALVDSGEAGGEGIATGLAEEIGTLDGGFETGDDFCAEFGGEALLVFGGFGAVEAGEVDKAVVVLLEGLPRGAVFADDLEDAVGFAGVESLAGDEAADDAHHAFDFVEFLGVERFEATFVYRNAFGEVGPEYSGGPDAEVGGFFGVDAVADGDDGVEVIEVDFTSDLAIPFLANYSIFSNS